MSEMIKFQPPPPGYGLPGTVVVCCVVQKGQVMPDGKTQSERRR